LLGAEPGGADISSYAAAAHAGVPVEFHVYPGAYHGFIHSDSRVARIYQRDYVAALRRALGVTDLREVQPT
jgi:dienelactone hydrolase